MVGKFGCAPTDTTAHASDSAAGRVLSACSCDASFPPCVFGSGQTQPRLLRKQAVHMGFFSSHFFFRRRQDKHPVRDRAPMSTMCKKDTLVHYAGFELENCQVTPKKNNIFLINSSLDFLDLDTGVQVTTPANTVHVIGNSFYFGKTRRFRTPEAHGCEGRRSLHAGGSGLSGERWKRWLSHVTPFAWLRLT